LGGSCRKGGTRAGGGGARGGRAEGGIRPGGEGTCGGAEEVHSTPPITGSYLQATITTDIDSLFSPKTINWLEHNITSNPEHLSSEQGGLLVGEVRPLPVRKAKERKGGLGNEVETWKAVLQKMVFPECPLFWIVYFQGKNKGYGLRIKNKRFSLKDFNLSAKKTDL
jgi:hypothetical protein